MSDEKTPRLGLPFLAAGQAQKEVMHNEALQGLDAVVQPVAISADVTEPPSSPVAGACWVLPAGCEGAWSGHDGAIAQWTGGGWRFSEPEAGWRCHILDRGVAILHDGAAWQYDMVRGDGFYVAGNRIIGARSNAISGPVGGTVVDVKSRAVINEILDALRGHGLIFS